MYQSSRVGTKGFGTIAADKFIYISVRSFFVSFEGSLVRQELATLGAWNLLLLFVQHLVVTKVAQHARGAVGVIIGQHLETDLANDFRFVLGVSMKEVPCDTGLLLLFRFHVILLSLFLLIFFLGHHLS